MAVYALDFGAIPVLIRAESGAAAFRTHRAAVRKADAIIQRQRADIVAALIVAAMGASEAMDLGAETLAGDSAQPLRDILRRIEAEV